MSGTPENPRSRQPFALSSPESTLRISRIRALTVLAVFCPSGAVASAHFIGLPSICGSASETFSDRPSPERTTTKRCSSPGEKRILTPSISVIECDSFSTISPLVAVSMRPARLSAMTSCSFQVAKLPRAQMSPFPTSAPTPRASRIPRPMENSSGSYPKRPRWPGPLPGVIPVSTISKRPVSPDAASLSRLGVSAFSSSVSPLGPGNPPSPSMTSRIIFVWFSTASDLSTSSRDLAIGEHLLEKFMGSEFPLFEHTPPSRVLSTLPSQGSLQFTAVGRV